MFIPLKIAFIGSDPWPYNPLYPYFHTGEVMVCPLKSPQRSPGHRPSTSAPSAPPWRPPPPWAPPRRPRRGRVRWGPGRRAPQWPGHGHRWRWNLGKARKPYAIWRCYGVFRGNKPLQIMIWTGDIMGKVNRPLQMMIELGVWWL